MDAGGGTDSELRWYALQTYAGREERVKVVLTQKIETWDGKDDPPCEILVPTQEVVEIKGGKRVLTKKRLYPGYVLVQMKLTPPTMDWITRVPGVIKFVGDGDPQPLRTEEINKILGIAEDLEEAQEAPEIPFRRDQVVEITEGPFKDFSGTVEEVLPEKGKVRVQVKLFGDLTPVELDYTELEGF